MTRRDDGRRRRLLLLGRGARRSAPSSSTSSMQKQYQEGYADRVPDAARQPGGPGRRHRPRPAATSSRPTTTRPYVSVWLDTLFGAERRQRAERRRGQHARRPGQRRRTSSRGQRRRGQGLSGRPMSDTEGEQLVDASRRRLRVRSAAGDGARAASSPARRRGADGASTGARTSRSRCSSGPAIVVFVAFVIFPVVMAAYYGFFRWKGYGAARPTSSACRTTSRSSPTRRSIDALRHNGFIVVMSLVIQGPARGRSRAAAQPQDARTVADPGAHLRAVRDLRGHRRHRLEPDARRPTARSTTCSTKIGPRRLRPGLARPTRTSRSGP